MTGDPGNETMTGDPGNETTTGDPGNETTTGDPGNETTTGNETMTADPGNETMTGDPGNETKTGDPGNEITTHSLSLLVELEGVQNDLSPVVQPGRKLVHSGLQLCCLCLDHLAAALTRSGHLLCLREQLATHHVDFLIMGAKKKF